MQAIQDMGFRTRVQDTPGSPEPHIALARDKNSAASIIAETVVVLAGTLTVQAATVAVVAASLASRAALQSSVVPKRFRLAGLQVRRPHPLLGQDSGPGQYP